jgi:clan AA aspartic protease (TIGR02281 family)
MEVDPNDRQHQSDSKSPVGYITIGIAAILLLSLYVLGAFNSEFRNLAGRDAVYAPIYQKYRMTPLPRTALLAGNAWSLLSRLEDEPCDKNSANSLSDNLSSNGYKREAVAFNLGFAEVCPDTYFQYTEASEILFDLGDYQASLDAANKAVATTSNYIPALFLKAKSLSKLSNHKDAVETYNDILDKFDVEATLGLDFYTELASSYAALGEYCEAASAIHTYIGYDAKMRDTTALQEQIKKYQDRGYCAYNFARRANRYVLKNGLNVADVIVNGVRGKFIVDTGASLVSVTPDFASRADIRPSARKAKFSTANGETIENTATLGSVELGGLTAKHVAASIMNKEFSPGIDGLLGMSFLSRFSIAVNGNTTTISNRAENFDSSNNESSNRHGRKKARRHRGRR